MYTDPFIDTDEWRDVPVRHRYVHGGFKGTELLLSFYFPPKDYYEGRFFQPLQAVSGNENTAPMAMYQASGVGFALASSSRPTSPTVSGVFGRWTVRKSERATSSCTVGTRSTPSCRARSELTYGS